MDNKKMTLIDVMIPLVIPVDGITRSELAIKLNVSYSEATKALESLRKGRLLRRHLYKSRYIYKLTGSRDALSVGTLHAISLN